MARPRKDGLEYYPFDTHFYEDDKIQLILSDFGIKGTHIFSRLLCAIYDGTGYYYVFDDDKCKLLSRKTCGEVSIEEVAKIVDGLINRGLFDRGMYEKYKILTSNGIQKRYLLITSKTKRLAPIDENYCLVRNNQNNGIVYSEETRRKLGGNSEETNNENGIYSGKSTQKEMEKEKEMEIKKTPSTTNCDSTENLEIIEGETENFGEMTVDVVDENIPLVNADKQTSETDNDFYMMFKNDAAAIEQMCIFTHKDRTAIMNFLIEFEAQCKYDGKFDKSYNDFKNHFRNWVNKRVSVKTSMSGRTVTRHNPNLRPGQCEYIDSDGRRRCADTNALIPDDAPPRPGNGSRWISSTKKWIPAGI